MTVAIMSSGWLTVSKHGLCPWRPLLLLAAMCPRAGHSDPIVTLSDRTVQPGQKLRNVPPRHQGSTGGPLHTDAKRSEMWPKLNRGKTTEALTVVSISLDYVSPVNLAVKKNLT